MVDPWVILEMMFHGCPIPLVSQGRRRRLDLGENLETVITSDDDTEPSWGRSGR